MTQTAPSAKRLSKQQWQTIIAEQQKSGMTQSDFCRSRGLGLATFYNWKRKLNSTENEATETSSQWVELPVANQPSPQQSWDIELELPGNVILRMRH